MYFGFSLYLAAVRAFPVFYVRDVGAAVGFYAQLGFEEAFRFPAEGEAGYFSLRLGDSQIGIVDAAWPLDQLGVEMGPAPRGELFVYVDDVDAVTEELRASGCAVLKEPADMPWGERIGYVADPEGNPVAIANRPA